MSADVSKLNDNAVVGASIGAHDPIKWIAKWELHKFEDPDGEIGKALKAGAPLSSFEALAHSIEKHEGNLLMYGGVSCLWQCLIGNGTGTAAQTLTFFNNGNAYIGVGDSSTAEAATQTDLQASTNKLRVGMDATYPQHTDATTSGAATITFRSSFTSGQANYAWAEWGVFNGSSGGRMLNRKVQANGTKSTGTWTLTVTLTIA